jgi:hypothetical protein
MLKSFIGYLHVIEQSESIHLAARRVWIASLRSQ